MPGGMTASESERVTVPRSAQAPHGTGEMTGFDRAAGQKGISHLRRVQ